MYYEEKLINGILMWRGMPDGDWKQCSIEEMSKRIVNAGLRQNCVKEIVFDNLIDSRTKEKLRIGKACHHFGCLNHITHPCEECWRVAGFWRFPNIRDDLKEYERDASPSVDVLVKIKGYPSKAIGRYIHGIDEWQVDGWSGHPIILEWWYLPENESGNKVD